MKIKCYHCEGKIEYDPVPWHDNDTCPHCGQEIYFSSCKVVPVQQIPKIPSWQSRVWRRVGKTLGYPVTSWASYTNDPLHAKLRSIRQSSSYPTLRGINESLAGISVVFNVVFLYVGLLCVIVSAATITHLAIFGVVGVILISIILSHLTKLMYEVSSLLLDMADCAITNASAS